MLDLDVIRQLQHLQQLSSLENSGVIDTRRRLKEIVEYFQTRDEYLEQLHYFAGLRKLKPETLIKADGFMVLDSIIVEDLPEHLRQEAYGFNRKGHCPYSGRFVLPVKDVMGNVAGFVGYDKFAEPKYLDSKNHGYKAKQGIIYGMEDMRKFYEEGYVIFVEGSMCKLWLKENDLNSSSTLGSYVSPYIFEIAKRFKDKAIFIPDADNAGAGYKEQIKRSAPQARVIRPIRAKDVDDSRQLILPCGASAAEEVLDELRRYIKNPFTKLNYFAP